MKKFFLEKMAIKAWKCEEFKKRFTALVSACVNMGYHPHLWRTSCTVVIPKPNKDKHEVRAYRPIALLNTMGKVVEKIVQRRLAYLTEDSLPPNQYGARHGFSAPDAVTKLVQDITSTRQFTSSMMIDIQGAFDNVHKDTLLDILKKLKLPSTAIRWVYHFMSERSTSLIIDGTPVPKPIHSHWDPTRISRVAIAVSLILCPIVQNSGSRGSKDNWIC
jgi:hypothetical protein